MEKLNTYERIFGDRAEIRVELEASLPEYLPNCARVVRVTAQPSLEGAALGVAPIVKGRVGFTLLYATDSRDCLRTAFFSEELEHTFPFRGDADALDGGLFDCLVSAVDTEAKVINPRRIMLSCTLRLALRVTARREQELCEISDDGTVAKRRAVANTVDVTELQNVEIRLSETVQPGNDAPEVGEVVLADCKFGRPAFSVRDGRCAFSGEAYLSFIYSDAKNAGNYIAFSSTLPYTAELSGDFDGASTAVCRATAVKVNAEPRIDSYGDSSGISLSVVGSLCGRIYRSMDVEYCEDVFGTEYELSVEKQVIPTDVIACRISESKEMCEDVAVRLGAITEIVTADIDIVRTETTASDGRITSVSRAALNILGRDGEGRLESAEAPFDISLATDASLAPLAERPQIDSTLCVSDVSAKIENGIVKVSFTAHLDAVVIATDSICAIASAAADESKEILRDRSRYIICYPSPEDTVWSVAKRYRASPDALRSQNSLSDDSLSGKHCIIIPR